MRRPPVLLVLMALALAAPAWAQAQPATQTPLTTLCIGLPECEPGYVPGQKPAPDPLAPANAALMREDWATARALLAPLAEAGNAEAQHKLGDLFYKGRGGAVDYLAAGKWYARAAEALGTDWAHEAQYNLGLMHAAGQGMPKDPHGALMWLEIATASGSDLAPDTAAILAAKLTPQQAAAAREHARTWLAARGK